MCVCVSARACARVCTRVQLRMLLCVCTCVCAHACFAINLNVKANMSWPIFHTELTASSGPRIRPSCGASRSVPCSHLRPHVPCARGGLPHLHRAASRLRPQLAASSPFRVSCGCAWRSLPALSPQAAVRCGIAPGAREKLRPSLIQKALCDQRHLRCVRLIAAEVPV